MSNLVIEITAPSIVAAIDKLIAAITPKAPMLAPLPQTPAEQAIRQQVVPAPTPTPAPLTAPVSQPRYSTPRQQYQPIAPVNPTPVSAVPTAATATVPKPLSAANATPPVSPATTYAAPTTMPVDPTPSTNQVPTTAPTYQMDDLARAAAQLMDAGKQQELLGLLAKFNVQSLTQLPQEQYGAFATELRQMGAKL